MYVTMNGENRLLVTAESVEFEKYRNRFKFKNSRRITDPFRRILWNIPLFLKGNSEDVDL